MQEIHAGAIVRKAKRKSVVSLYINFEQGNQKSKPHQEVSQVEPPTAAAEPGLWLSLERHTDNSGTAAGNGNGPETGPHRGSTNRSNRKQLGDRAASLQNEEEQDETSLPDFDRWSRVNPNP
jgi:hypothetical protein